MRRLPLFMLLAIAVPLFALTRSPRPGDRIGVLRMSDEYSHGAEQTVAKTVQSDLRKELRALGFDAFNAQMTLGQLRREQLTSDYYVEIVSSHSVNQPVAGGAGERGDFAVEVAVVVSQVAARVQLYDGRTLELIESYDLQNNRAAVVPMAVGVGGRSLWYFAAIPFIHYGQYRAAAHEVARQAAERIAGR